jgi:hypothetical protein
MSQMLRKIIVLKNLNQKISYFCKEQKTKSIIQEAEECCHGAALLEQEQQEKQVNFGAVVQGVEEDDHTAVH